MKNESLAFQTRFFLQNAILESQTVFFESKNAKKRVKNEKKCLCGRFVRALCNTFLAN